MRRGAGRRRAALMAAPRVAVAVSGGRDSTALLHCTARAAAALGVEVVALHVHHGLMPAGRRLAAAGASAVPALGCAASAAGGSQARPPPGASVEAWARARTLRRAGRRWRARRAVHMRAAGAPPPRPGRDLCCCRRCAAAAPAGLSAMPREAVRDGLVWARPWLAQPREAIEAYVRRHRLRTSTTQQCRPALRAQPPAPQVWPALARPFRTPSRRWRDRGAAAQEAARCLDELAALDLAAARGPGAARAALAGAAAGAPPQCLARLAAPARCGAGAREPGQRLWTNCRRRAGPLAGAGPSCGCTAAPELCRGRRGRDRWQPRTGLVVDLHRPGACRCRPGAAAWSCRAATRRRPAAGAAAPGEVRARRRRAFQAGAGRTARSLKKQYQARGVPAWHAAGRCCSQRPVNCSSCPAWASTRRVTAAGPTAAEPDLGAGCAGGAARQGAVSPAAKIPSFARTASLPCRPGPTSPPWH